MGNVLTRQINSKPYKLPFYSMLGKILSPSMIGIMIFIIFLWALASTWLNVELLRLQYEIARAHKTQQTLTELNRKLKLEKANLTTPKNLERLGSQLFGLQFPAPWQIVVLKDNHD